MDQEVEQRHTEDMQDIIGTPPSWLIRWGITVFFAVLVLIAVLSELITYPDLVKTQLKINSFDLPHPVVLKAPGKLVKLMVKNNMEVKKGQELAFVETPSGKIILTAPYTGNISYVGIVHENQELSANKTLFYINSNNLDFFGEMIIPPGSITKVKEGQEVLVKLRMYSYEEYGILHGTIKYIADSQFKNGGYIAEVDFKTQNITDMRKALDLKPGMTAEADIVTQNTSLYKRVTASLFKSLHY
jgi:multidrug efflux pump subunit AcrA (membrane-fusion protein)